MGKQSHKVKYKYQILLLEYLKPYHHQVTVEVQILWTLSPSVYDGLRRVLYMAFSVSTDLMNVKWGGLSISSL